MAAREFIYATRSRAYLRSRELFISRLIAGKIYDGKQKEFHAEQRAGNRFNRGALACQSIVSEIFPRLISPLNICEKY